MKNSAWLLLSLVVSLGGMPSLAQGGAPPLSPPSEETLTEARKIISQMRANPRGPYSNIQWVCKDGVVLPPKAGACVPHGGGNQYAKFSPDREKLARMGFPVGTIYIAFDRPPQPADTRPFNRLRDLPLEQYMIDIDDGWVLHKARGYRGRVQIEDEEQAGHQLLLELLTQPARSSAELLLLRELAKVVPHRGASEDPTREVRRLSQTLAETDQRFEPLRSEIHGKPSSSTISRVRDWQAKYKVGGKDLVVLNQLIEGLDGIYGEAGRAERLEALSSSLAVSDPEIAAAIINTTPDPLSNAGDVLSKVRSRYDVTSDPKQALIYLDAMTALEAEVIAAARTQAPARSRLEAMKRALILARAAKDLGWLSATEGDKLITPMAALLEGWAKSPSGVPPARYSSIVKDLQLAPAWAQGIVRYTFAEPLARYTALDKRASHFIDDLLRGSVLQPLSEVAQVLTRDNAALSGVQARMMGKSVNALALNPGQAIGTLRVLEVKSDGELPRYDPKDIIVIPNTTSELFPAAGIITVGEGNPLSHIQILARNLGIPNIIIDSPTRGTLVEYDKRRVMLSATQDGRILIRLEEAGVASSAEKPVAAPTQISREGTISAPMPDLSRISPIPRSELRAKLSGVAVGPKAANVGELAHLFPDRIAPALALPFGAFAAHTEAGPNAPRPRLKAAFAAFDAGSLSEDEFLLVLDDVRKQTSALKLTPETRRELEAIMESSFAPGAGIFVRSDTNMEDLPQFTGAGLNLTLPNVRGQAEQFAAISEVWASVYTRRAMAWRSQILSNPDDVFSSVLLMQSVPSEKSGVMVTTDLTGRQMKNSLTISVAWGVGGAVDNESAAAYLLGDKSHLLLSEAKAPYQRYLRPEGGVGWRAAAAGPVLTEGEIKELRKLAKEVVGRYPPSLDAEGRALPFDIEFGFAEGKLYLLQIRPLVQRGTLAAEATVSAVIPKPKASEPVNLEGLLIE